MRLTLPIATLLAVTAAGCKSSATFTRTCYDVPDAVAAVRGDTTVTATGLRYIDVSVGAGAEAVTCTEASVSYTGTLLNGTQFDAGSFAFIPGAAQVIAGFEQGVVGMRVDGARRIIVPPELGYGPEEQRDRQTGEVLIPANSTLVFDVTLNGVRQIGGTQ